MVHERHGLCQSRAARGSGVASPSDTRPGALVGQRAGNLGLDGIHCTKPISRLDPAGLAAAIDDSGLIELPVSARHAAAVARLPLHHIDPFDRLLIAQASTEPFRFVTADRALAVYGPNIDVI